MNDAAWVFLPGFVLEFVGLCLVARGFLGLWETFARGEGFTSPAVRALLGLGERGRRTLQTFLRRPQNVVIQAGTVTATASVGNPTIRTTYNSPPSITDDPEAFAELIHERMQEMSQQFQDYRDRTNAALEQEREQRRRTDARLNEGQRHLDGRIRDLAVGNIRLQVLGWFLVLTGFVTQAVSNLMTLGR
jgi:hypothetical protein